MKICKLCKTSKPELCFINITHNEMLHSFCSECRIALRGKHNENRARYFS